MTSQMVPPALREARWAADIIAATSITDITAGGSQTEIVTAITPVMRTRPITDPITASSASCQTTEATRPARVGDLVTVEHRGICDRIATSMITQLPETE